MQIEIKNFKAVEKLSMELAEKLTLIDGPNGSGKSTTLEAIKNLVLASPNCKKSEAQLMVNRGAAKGSISGNGVTVEYPKLSIVGEPSEQYSLESLDIRETPLLMSDKERSNFFIKLFKAEPTYDDLYNKCTFIPEKIRAEKVSLIWEAINKNGWDKAEKNSSEAATGFKRKWKDITGQNFGTKVAENWIHDDYNEELETMGEGKICTELEDARQIHRDSIAASAVSDEKVTELEKLIESEDTVKADFEKVCEDIVDIDERVADYAKKRNVALENKTRFEEQLPTKQIKYSCPCCEKSLVIIDGVLVEEKPMTDDEISEINKSIDVYQKEFDEYVTVIKNNNEDRLALTREEMKHNEILSSIGDARKKLEEMKTSKKDIDTPEKCMEMVEKWEKNLNAYGITKKAKEAYENYLYYNSVKDVLSVDGVRKDKVFEAVGKFNSVADKVFYKWSYRADSDFSVTNSVGSDYKRLSDGEKWCARVVYQVVSSIIQGDKLILIDTIEDVDRDNINALCEQLYNANIRAVIARASDAGEKETFQIENMPDCKRFTISGGILK